jgi:hypothetical protein
MENHKKEEKGAQQKMENHEKEKKKGTPRNRNP